MPKYLTNYGNPITQWKPVHDQIAALHIAGHGPDSIATITGVTKGHVYRVLNDPRTLNVIEFARKRAYGQLMTTIQDKMVGVGEQAIDNIASTINTKVEDSEGNVAVGTKAKIHQDNVSFELLDRIGYGKHRQKDEGAGGIQLSPEAEKKLVAGIERAKEAQNIFEKAEEDEVVEVSDDNGKKPE